MDLNGAMKWILLYVLWSSVSCKVIGAYDWQATSSFGGFPMRSEMACEDYIIEMECPGRDVIQIVSAEYGRRTPLKCSESPSKTENTNCALEGAKDIVSQKCNNKTTCTFQVSSENFPDPCPGTYKYLETNFNCVRYMFNCPGSLTGIGEEISTTIDLTPQSGMWTKDPLFNTEHVFFATSSGTVHEYSSWDDFEHGIGRTRFDLPGGIAGGKIVVYDRKLYYIKAGTRTLVRFSLNTKSVTKEVEITERRGYMRRNQNISISADEQGLWLVYSRSNGALTIRKMDKDSLQVIDTWVTNRRFSDYPHTFFICGVMYGVSRRSKKIDFSFNTNVKTNHIKDLKIEFDLPETSFLRYDPLAIVYNARDQILYSWDATQGKALYYKLHFDGENPAKAIKTTQSLPSTTTSTTSTTVTTSSSTSSISTRTTTEPTPPDRRGPQRLPVNHCASITRGGLLWPVTKVGNYARIECPTRKGEYASWKCERDSSMREADWSVAGPDVSKCSVWVTEIGDKYKSGLIGLSTAFEMLTNQIEDEAGVSDMPLNEITNLVDKLFEDSTVPSLEEAAVMAESMNAISDHVLSNHNAMAVLSNDAQIEVASSLMNSTEKAGFLYADAIAQTPPEMRQTESDSVTLSSANVVMEINIIERTTNETELMSMTSFPSGESLEAAGQISDLIEVPTSEIMAQPVAGPAIVLFSLYNNLSQYLDSNGMAEWRVDSRVISAALQQQNYHTILTKPAVITLQHSEASRSSHRCVFWDFKASEGRGNWSDAGCSLRSSNLTHSVCECYHLTSFAVLVNHAGVEIAKVEEHALDIITKVGISISIVCLVLCIFTFCYFRNIHSDRTSVHKHLCICLLVAEVVFLVGIDRTENTIACSIIAGILHYFFLAAFLWMAVEGFLLYVMLVEVFEIESRWKWYYFTGYVLPAFTVGIATAVDYTGYGTENVCWLRIDNGFIWSFVGPVLIIILVNLGFLIMTLYKMYTHTMAFSDIGRINSIKASVRGASVLLCLLGITWAFGILYISDHVAIMAYLFCIFNAFQGMFIFIFHCLLPKKVRKEYERFFSRLPCSSTFSDSYLSNSSSFSKKYSPGRYPIPTSPSGLNRHSSLQQQSHLRRMWSETMAPRNSDGHDTLQSRESSHVTASPSRNVRPFPANYLQEDEVFLPPSNNARTELILHRAGDDLRYDRLQHHYHPGDYLIFPGEARPLGNYETGRAPHNKGQFGIHNDHPTPIMGVQQFGPKSVSQSKIQEIVSRNSCTPGSRIRRENQRSLRRSFDENINGKRDSGIGLQRPPSMISAQNTRANHRRSLDNVLLSLRSKETNELRDESRSNCQHRVSLDNINRSRMPSVDRRHSPPGQAPTKSYKISPLTQRSVNSGRKSVSSDSDDPIVTDCSVSSASSGNQITSHPITTSYYEEPICQKMYHQESPIHNDNNNLQHHRNSNASDARDDDDLEVEMITNSDSGPDLRNKTLGYPPYRPPTPPRVCNNPPTATPRTIITRNPQRNNSFDLHSPPDRVKPIKPARHAKSQSRDLTSHRILTGI